MDDSRFDDLAKQLGAQRSRRGVLGALAGAALASFGVRSAEASRCRSLGNSCRMSGDCCSGACVAESRTRKICHCGSASDCPAGDQCHPAACVGGACSAPVAINAPCDDGNPCTANDVCQADGSCAGTPISCTAPNECYTAGTCQPADGSCSPAVYHGDGAACSGGICFNNACCAPESAAATCAGGKCGAQTNNCNQTVQCLTLAGGACGADGECCSNVCVDGTCQAGPVATGGACDSNGDCASHNCCANVCRDLTSDPDNCGGCATICSSNHITTRTCAAGVCDGACAQGFDDCDRDKLSNGCETNTTTDVSNCGGCHNACPPNPANGAYACSGGACTLVCNSGYTNCSGTCRNLRADINNCGTCGRACPVNPPNGSYACSGGVCLLTCTSGYTSCSGSCVNLTASDNNNCGACNLRCAAGETCSAGVCKCGSSAACDMTHYCSGGACQQLCPTGTCHCGYCAGGPDGSVCSSGGGYICSESCNADRDCASGQICLTGYHRANDGTQFLAVPPMCYGDQRGVCSDETRC